MKTRTVSSKKKLVIKKIVIVDDDREYLEEMQEALMGDSYSVIAVNDSRVAMDVIRTIKPDLILLDLKMPYKNGLQVAKEIKAQSEYMNIPIILLSGIISAENRTITENGGTVEFLSKPINIIKLKSHIEDLLHTSCAL
jgi:DNA-binding response OmpR family regulator